MEKKKYLKPSMAVYDIKQPTRLLVGSYDLGRIPQSPNIPTIPGAVEDEKHLA